MGKKIQHQQKEEEISEDNSDDRWLHEQINSMKKRMISKSLYENKQYQQRKEDSSQRENQWVKVNKRSIVWRHFLLNRKNNQAICILCDTVYQLGGASTTIMLYHLRAVHPQKLANTQYHGKIQKIAKTQKTIQTSKSKRFKKSLYQRISQGKGKVKVAHAQVFSDMPLHLSLFQIARLLQSKFNYQPSEIKDLLYKNCWAYQNNIDSMISKLSIHRHIVILQCILQDKTDKIQSICLITQTMRENLFMFQDLISLWYMPFPLENNQIAASIYVIVQNKNLEPLFAGLILLFCEPEINITQALQKFFFSINIMPKTLVVCGPLFLLEAHRKFLNYQNIKSVGPKQKLHLIHLNTDLESLGAEMSMKNYIFSVCYHLLKREEVSFIGFSLSLNFIEKILQLTPAFLKKKYTLVEFLQQFFGIQKKINEDIFTKRTIQKAQIFGWVKQNFPEIIHQQTLKIIKMSIQPNLFQKLLFSYLYGKFMLSNQPTTNSEYIIRQKNLTQCLFGHVITQPIIVKQVSQNNWICSCYLKQFLGIPCPHIIQIICMKNELFLRNQIGERWIHNNENNSRERGTEICFTKNMQVKIGNFINQKIFLSVLFE